MLTGIKSLVCITRYNYFASLTWHGVNTYETTLTAPLDHSHCNIYCVVSLTDILFVSGVTPVYTDKETCSFVWEEKQQQYEDLKHALSVMGRMENPSSQRRKLSSDHLIHPPPSHLSPSPSNLQITSSKYLSSTSIGQSKPSTFGQVSKKVQRSSVPSIASGSGGLWAHCLVPENMVLMYLLENNRLLLSSVNQMKQEAQV